ncbi:MAG: serine/threonine-protein phosphatase [Flavobacteriales bacterium]|nr:serine/threonine-protein phosphatase [Flavobacteriales bacterium]
MGIIAVVLVCLEFLMQGESRDVFLVCLMLLGLFLADSRKESVAVFIVAIMIFLVKWSIPSFINVDAIPHESLVGHWVNLTVGSIALVMIVDMFKTDGHRFEELLSNSNAQLELKRAEADAQLSIMQRRSQKLSAKNAEAIAVNRDIQDSIRYARRIQTSMLLTKEQLRHRLPDSLLFYRPKDVLSGDFYWFAEVDGFLFLAIADCTGHGVPGAMMTVMGNNLLHQIIGRDNILGPAAILMELDRHIVGLLGQRNAPGDVVNDGMDMALIRIDRGVNVITFASAKRPLFAFHGTGGDLTEYPASRQSIGGQFSVAKSFPEMVIPFASGDTLYLTSDGYADQFGPKGKFLSKRFRRLLQDMHRKSMSEQHRLLNETLLRWKVTEPQTDDILVFGLKL